MIRPRPLPLIAALLLALAGTATAHDIPNERVDRAIQVILEPGSLRVEYEVSLAELTLARDLRNLTGTMPNSDRQALFDAYGKATGPLDARGFLVSVDGTPIDLEFRGFDLVVEDHPRFTFQLDAPIPLGGRLLLHDTNYASSEGTSRLALRTEGAVTATGYDGAASVESVPIRPVWQLSDREELATKRVEVEYASKPPPDEAPPPRPIAARPTPAPAASIEANSPTRGSETLSRLLDRASSSWAWLALVALGLGAAHALQPGHGKTLVAAVTIGHSGGWLRGGLLAIVTTLAHFSAVLAIASLLWSTRSVRPASLHVELTHAAGFVIAGLGLWRLGRYLGGHEARAEANAGAEVDRVRRLPWRSIVGLGIAGGMVPCWDAVALILLSDLAGRLALGLILLAGFSLGMAGVLIGVGLVASRFGRALSALDRAGRWEHRLGIASGLVLSGFGLYLFLS